MSDISDRSAATLTALEKVGAINHDLLLSRAAEVQASLRRVERAIESDAIGHRSMIHFGDVVGVAAEVQRLGFATERVQQR